MVIKTVSFPRARFSAKSFSQGILPGLLLTLSCSGAPGSESLGSIEIAVEGVPTGVECLRIQAHGTRAVRQSFSLLPGANTLSMSGLPLGDVSMFGEAFDGSCSALTSDAVPSWISQAVSVEIQPQVIAQVALVLRRNGRANVDIGFETGGTGGVGGQSAGGSGGTGDAGATSGGAAGASGSNSELPAGDDLSTSVHIELGVPIDADPEDDYLINRQEWVASYNNARRVSNWVAWRVTPSDLGSVRRQDNFRPDPLLPADFFKVTGDDYRNSGYDRGHLCPSGDRTGSASANSATFLMTNMHPQLPDLNQKVWNAFEEFTRSLVRTGKNVFVIAGGVFDSMAANKTIGPGIHVPIASWKIIAVLEPGETAEDIDAQTTVYALQAPNTNVISGNDWLPYATSVDEVERSSGYDLMRDVEDDVETFLESRITLP